METAFNILVIILSLFLAIFLILGIVILLYAYRLAKSAKKLGEQAEASVKGAQEFMKGVSNKVAPAFAAAIQIIPPTTITFLTFCSVIICFSFSKN